MLILENYNIDSSPENRVFNNNQNEKQTFSACPHCKSLAFIKYGKYNNIPRFKCKCCFRTFSLRTNTVWYYSKKTPDQWKEFCALQMDCKPLSYCAKALNINIATAFYWRHKILNVLKNLTEPETLQKHVFMQHHFIKESFKGTKNAPKTPRARLWTIFSYDSFDNSLNIPFSRHGWRRDNFHALIYSKVAPKTYISPGYGNNFITAFARNQNKRYKKPEDNSLSAKVTDILLSYQNIISKTKGISTKYLTQYLALSKAHCLTKVFNLMEILHNTNLDKLYIKSKKIKTLTSIHFKF